MFDIASPVAIGLTFCRPRRHALLSRPYSPILVMAHHRAECLDRGPDLDSAERPWRNLSDLWCDLV